MFPLTAFFRWIDRLSRLGVNLLVVKYQEIAALGGGKAALLYDSVRSLGVVELVGVLDAMGENSSTVRGGSDGGRRLHSLCRSATQKNARKSTRALLSSPESRSLPLFNVSIQSHGFMME